MTRYFGIDPGGSGGIASLDDFGNIEAIKMPEDERTLWECLSGTIDPKADYVVLEQVSGYMPGDEKQSRAGIPYRLGVAPGSRMFTFGQSYGTLRMALVAVGMVESESWVTVRPNEWQKGLRNHLERLGQVESDRTGSTDTNGGTTPTLSPRNRKGGESRESYKRRLKEVAEYLFPQYNGRITLKVADAILLALYCKHRFENVSTSRTLWG